MCTGSALQILASSQITARYSVLILTSFTLILALAEVSIKAQLNCRAKFTPWSLPTTRSSSKSHLFPTNTIGTSSVSCTQGTSLQIKYFAVGQITIESQVHCSINYSCAIIHVKWLRGMVREQHFRDMAVPRASGLTLTLERQHITDAAYSPRLI